MRRRYSTSCLIQAAPAALFGGKNAQPTYIMMRHNVRFLMVEHMAAHGGRRHDSGRLNFFSFYLSYMLNYMTNHFVYGFFFISVPNVLIVLYGPYFYYISFDFFNFIL